MPEAELMRTRRVLFALTAVHVPLVMGLALVTGLRVDVWDFLPLCLVVVAYFGLIRLLAQRFGIPAFVGLAEVYGLGLVNVVPVVTATYLAMRVGMPLADDRLLAMDAVFRFDWVALVRWIDGHALLALTLNQAYDSIQWQMLVIPLVLALSGQLARSYQLVIGYVLICALSSVISVWFPAAGQYIVHGLDPHSLAYIKGELGTAFLTQFDAVRDNPGFVLQISHSQGILTFPSVHAGVAALCAWAAWSQRWLRYPVALLNVAMAFSAMIVSNHYAIDIVAGGGVAGLSVALTLLACGARSARPVSRRRTATQAVTAAEPSSP
mgnify:CR=1 FL=1